MASTRGFVPKKRILPTSEESTEGATLPVRAGARLAQRAKKYTDPDSPEGYRPYYSLRADYHFTPVKKEIFIFTLAERGTMVDACDAASISLATAKAHRNANNPRFDPEFAEAWNDAMEEFDAGVEREIADRAMNGWQEPVIGGPDRNEIVTYITKKSDKLLVVLAKRRMRDLYGDKVEVNQTGGTVGSSTEIAPGVDLVNLDAKQRGLLKKFLEGLDPINRSDVLDLEVEGEEAPLTTGPVRAIQRPVHD